MDVTIDFAPISSSEVTAWRAGISLLLQLLMESNLVCTFKAHWVGAHDQW